MGSGDEKSNKYEFCEKDGKSATNSNDISREYEKSKGKIKSAAKIKSKSGASAKIKTAAKTCFALAFTLALLTGCWDKVELENRGFAVSLGIDEKDGKYLVTVSMPSVSSLKEGPSDSAKDVRSEESDTVSGAIRAIDDSLSQRLDFGQAKLLLFGQELLDNEDMFRQAIDACERNGELNREIYVLAADGGARKVLEQKLDDEPAAGVFVQNYYKNGEGLRQYLEGLISELRSNESALIPEIRLLEREKDKFALEVRGASVIGGFKRQGSLSEDEARGFMWAKKSCAGIEVAVSHDGARVPLRVTQSKPKARLVEADDGTLLCHVNVKASGVIEEFNFDGKSLSDNERLEKLSELYKETIREEILTTFQTLKDKNSDAYGFRELLRKTRPGLHKARESDWNSHFQSMNILPAVDVDIISAGAVK